MSKTPTEIQREALYDILSGIEGVKKVYYQQPYSKGIVYPCIIYGLNRLETKYASDRRYLTFPSYMVTLIDYDPDTILQKKILDLDGPCSVSFDRFFTDDNLYHWAYTLVFTESLW